MTDLGVPIRVLALSAHRRKIGYVVLEGPTQLLDWGVRSCVGIGHDSQTLARRRIVRLLQFYLPSVVAVRQVDQPAKQDAKGETALLAIRQECGQRSIPVNRISRTTIGQFFLGRGCGTKHQIAQLLAEQLPELAWILPPKRKPWQSEKHSMAVFDAAAVGITYFQTGQAPLGHSFSND